MTHTKEKDAVWQWLYLQLPPMVLWLSWVNSLPAEYVTVDAYSICFHIFLAKHLSRPSSHGTNLVQAATW